MEPILLWRSRLFWLCWLGNIYNTLNKENGKDGYVMGATKMAKTFAENGWGTWTQDVKIPTNRDESDFKVGDIFSMNGHVWISFGTCDDGSIVITHSTPSKSINGQPAEILKDIFQEK